MATVQPSALILGAILSIAFASVHTGGTTAAQNVRQQTTYDGQALFKTYCATCHGVSGKGDGPFAAALRKRPPDLTQLTKQNQGTFPAQRVAKAIDGRDADRPHGPADMPVWGDAFSRTTHDSDPEFVRLKIEALVKSIESIQERPATESADVHRGKRLAAAS